MREPAILSRRALAAALPFAALAVSPAAAMPASLEGGDDAALLDLGRRWAKAWDAQVANDRASTSAISNAEVLKHEAVGDRLYEAEHELFDAIAATPARTIGGLAVKAQVLARTHDIEERGVEAVEAAAAGAWELTTLATFSLVLDILRLAQVPS